MTEKKHTGFSSRWGFLLAAVGSAVGMANVWGFPAKMGANGGGAFLVAYLIFVALFSAVGLAAEFAVGRKYRAGVLGTYRHTWKSGHEKLGRVGGFVGWLPLIGTMCIAVGYAVIVAYVLKAFWSSVTGELMHADTAAWFESFSGAAYSVVPFHIIVVVGTLLTLLVGAKGIEKSNKFMMPLFFVIFLVLAVRVGMLDGAWQGYKFMFTPRWEYLKDPMVWVWAMGQAFFSLSVIGTGMVIYGSYLQDGESVTRLAVRTALFDTTAALVAAMVIIPACFAYGLDVGAGPSLLFVTLPKILQDMPMGGLFAVILYVAMIFAGVSSLQNLFETVAASLTDQFPRLGRAWALVIVGAVCMAVGINMEPIAKWGPWMDMVSIYIIPIGAMLGAVSWFWVMKKRDLMRAVDLKSAAQENLWYRTGRYLYVPCAMILCAVALFMQVAF